VIGQRAGEFDVYAVPAAGGSERRLTTAPGLDDGAEYSPDGQWIYFNSVRSGNMKIWRMHPDGSQQEQVTFGDDSRDWFPHVSPDGKWIAFVAFGTDTAIGDHPANHDVMLKLMPTSGGTPTVIAKLFGGQGTMNVNSWSPDSKQIAFVSYRPVH
jgi:Tol biopolymer transport system component